MLRYIIRRFFTGLFVLFVASVAVFVLVAESGDPLGILRSNPSIPRSAIALRAKELHLNLPLWDRYWLWISHAVRGDFGQDFYRFPVFPEFKLHLFITLRMVIGATILAIVIALSLGVLAALKRGKVTDHAITLGNFVFLAAPVFIIGLVLKVYVATPIDKWWGDQLLPTEGAQSPTLPTGSLHVLGDYVSHAILPTISVILASYASWAIYQRSTLLDVMDSDFVRFARSKGISSRRVLLRHTLRNALIPVITVIALDFAGILGGALITEIVFGWAGLGRWFLTAVNNQDINSILAYLMFTATLVIVFNLIADIFYAVLDPRIRYA
jgi:peptide/nickel transport system permease protein